MLFVPVSGDFWPVNLVECELVIQQAERENKPEQEWWELGMNEENMHSISRLKFLSGRCAASQSEDSYFSYRRNDPGGSTSDKPFCRRTKNGPSVVPSGINRVQADNRHGD
jgi:hypothetical protein